MFTSFSTIMSPRRLAAATHSVRPEKPKYSTARSGNGLGPRSEADVVLDLAILTNKSSAVRIQHTSAGLVERRTICDATKTAELCHTLSLRSSSRAEDHAAPSNFPIFAKLLNERYEPVAPAAEGVIYRVRWKPNAAASRNTSRVSCAQRCQENTLARSIPAAARSRR
jgi:hypothetical protein